MIDHVWTVVCSNSVTDAESNNVSLLNVLEQVNVTGESIPGGVLPAQVDIVTLWSRADYQAPERGYGRITFLSPSGSQLGEPMEFPVDLSQHHRGRSRHRLIGLPLEEAGRYVFRINFRSENEEAWHQVASVPLEVTFQPPQSS
jgi:hypothetical protein